MPFHRSNVLSEHDAQISTCTTHLRRGWARAGPLWPAGRIARHGPGPRHGAHAAGLRRPGRELPQLLRALLAARVVPPHAGVALRRLRPQLLRPRGEERLERSEGGCVQVDPGRLKVRSLTPSSRDCMPERWTRSGTLL